MMLPAGFVIEAHDGPRWEVVGPGPVQAGMREHRVRDLRKDMDRELQLFVPDYGGVPADRLEWDVPYLRRRFTRVAELLCRQLTALPVPVDRVALAPPPGVRPESIAGDEPGLIVMCPAGKPIHPEGKARRATEWDLHKLAGDALTTLDVLHAKKLLLRQMPPATVRLSLVTFRVGFAGFQTLCRMDEQTGIHRLEPGFHPDPRWAAPECFEPDAPLGPASDLYALGMTLLANAGGEPQAGGWDEAGLDHALDAAKLPPLWRDTLRGMLHREPSRRFQSAGDVMRFLSTGGTARPTPRTLRGLRPPAALVAIAPRRDESTARLDYGAILRQLEGTWDVRQRLYVAHGHAGDNPFFRFLQQRHGFEICARAARTAPGTIVRDVVERRLGRGGDLIVLSPVEADVLPWLMSTPQAMEGRLHLIHIGAPPPPGAATTLSADRFLLAESGRTRA